MIRQTALRQLTIARANASRITTHQPVLAAKNYSVLGAAKEVLSKANKKTGEVLAGSMETVEKVTPTTETISKTAQDVNKKTGEILADGMEKVEPLVPGHGGAENVGQKVKEAANTVNKKTGEVLANGMDKAEDYIPGSDDVKNAAGNAAETVSKKAGNAKKVAENANERAGEIINEGTEEAKEKVEGTVDRAEARHRVNKHAEGYKDLQDKGSKVEVEQNRPDDAV